MLDLHLHLSLCNPVDSQRRWRTSFRVEPGSMDCVVPSNILRSIGITPITRRTLISATGRGTVIQAGIAVVSCADEVAGVTVIFGNDDDGPTLGLTAMQSLGIDIDRENQQIVRRRAIRLKGAECLSR